MKADTNALTFWTCFLSTPKEPEILQAAKEMKGGTAYLFRHKDGSLIMRNRKTLNCFEQDKETFLRKVNLTNQGTQNEN